MAGIRKKGDGYHCTFRFQGKRYYFAVGDVTEAQANAKGTEVDETLALIERGRITVPEGVALEDFVACGGKVPVVSARPETATARQLFDQYLAAHGNGTLESSTLVTLRIHLKRLAETVGERFRIQGLSLADLQGHVDRRRKKAVAPATLKKEIATARACWNWAVSAGHIKGTFPSRGLRFPRGAEKEPFRTFAEIEALVAADAFEGADALWECLYLTLPKRSVGTAALVPHVHHPNPKPPRGGRGPAAGPLRQDRFPSADLPPRALPHHFPGNTDRARLRLKFSRRRAAARGRLLSVGPPHQPHRIQPAVGEASPRRIPGRPTRPGRGDGFRGVQAPRSRHAPRGRVGAFAGQGRAALRPDQPRACFRPKGPPPCPRRRLPPNALVSVGHSPPALAGPDTRGVRAATARRCDL